MPKFAIDNNPDTDTLCVYDLKTGNCLGEVDETIGYPTNEILVHVLAITHKFGTDVYLCATHDLAVNELRIYVEDQWNSESLGAIPNDHEEAIAQYFSESDEEWQIGIQPIITEKS